MKQKELKNTAYNVYSAPGDAIQGERITAQARKIHKPVICTGTASHRIQQTKLEGSVFCIIDRPLNFLRDVVSKP